MHEESISFSTQGASHFAFGKFKVRERFVLEGSRALNVSYVYSNLVGNEAGRSIYDGALVKLGRRNGRRRPEVHLCRRAQPLAALVDVDATRSGDGRPAVSGPICTKSDSCVEADSRLQNPAGAKRGRAGRSKPQARTSKKERKLPEP